MTFGQGRPQVEASDRRMGFRTTACWLQCCALMLCINGGWAAQAQQSTNEMLDCELRVVWGGPVQRVFAGKIELEAGTLEPIRNLSLQPDSVGAIREVNKSTIQLLAHSPSQFGGVDLRLHAPASSKIKLRFDDPFQPQPIELEVVLGELLQGNWIKLLDQRGTRVAIERQIHDRVRVDTKRPHAVYEPGEKWSGRISGYHTGLPAGEYTLSTRFEHAAQHGSEPLSRTIHIDETGSFAAMDWELQIPEQEAAYTLEFNLTQRRFLNNLISPASLTRRIELVALSTRPRTERIGDWKPLATIDMLAASKTGSLEWLTPLTMPLTTPLSELSSWVGGAEKWQQMAPLLAVPKPSTSHGQLSIRPFHDPHGVAGGQCLSLAPNAWIALPLSGLQPGIPHRIRIQAPTDQPMQLAVSIRSPGMDGELPALSPDGGLAINARECTLDGQIAGYDMIFWPTTGNVHLLFANNHTSHQACIASVVVEVAELAAEEASVESVHHQRMLGIYLDKPLIAAGFAAADVVDPLTKRPLNSWSTWYQAAERVEQLMDLSAADTLVLKAFADGGAIFPSQQLQPSRRFDNGTFFSDGRCPEIKDSIELILRRFDRSGKKLVLALDIDSSLPALVELEDGPSTALQRNLEGATWPIREGQDSYRHVRYNPLDQRVQAAMIAALQEIVERYAHHPSFAGICLQMDPNSQLLFAGDKWGFDQETLQQFAQSAQIRLPSQEQLSQLLAGPVRLAILTWRAKEMTKFYARVSASMRSIQPESKLYLNAVRLWEKQPDDQHFVDPDAIIRNPAEYLMAHGIDAEGIAEIPGAMLVHGSLERNWDTGNAKDWVLGMSSMRAVQSSATGLTAAVVTHQPQGFRLAALDQLAGTERNPSSQWIFPNALSYAAYARKPFIEQLYYADPLLLASGSWLPVAGQQDAMRSIYLTLKELPAVTLKPVTPLDPQSNLRIRSGKFAGKTYLQFVNNAPWSETVKLQVRGESHSPPTRILGQLGREELFHVNSPGNWELHVPAFDVIALEVADEWLEIVGSQSHSAPEPLQRIAAELEQIETMVAEAGNPAYRQPLAELGGAFENWLESGRPLGWNVSTLPNVSVGRSFELPHSGRTALVIENRNTAQASAWIQSQPFAPPATGRLVVQAWLRVRAAADPIHVRLSIIGRYKDGQRFERSQVYGGDDVESAIANDWGRRPATLYIADVPSADLAEISVAIDLVGPGKVWVDDVEAFELRLHPDERIYLRGQILVAKQQLAEKNPFPAEQLLDGSWGHYLAGLAAQDSQDKRAASASSTKSNPPGKANTNWDEQKPIILQWRDSVRDRWRR